MEYTKLGPNHPRRQQKQLEAEWVKAMRLRQHGRARDLKARMERQPHWKWNAPEYWERMQQEETCPRSSTISPPTTPVTD